MNLETYCPEIELISRVCDKCRLYGNEKQDLIAAALRREIIKRGEWGKFYQFAERSWWNADDAIIKPDEDDHSAFNR